MTNPNRRISGKKLLPTLAITGGLLLLAVSLFPDSVTPKNRHSSAVAATSDNQVAEKLDLVSLQNGREIKLTKFVATSDRIEFDYQFKLDDDKLKMLLKKKIAASSNYQDIQFEVFAADKPENLALGGTSESTFRIEEDTYFGSVVFIFTHKTLPKYPNLTLHINQLSWEDYDVHQAALANAIQTKATSFEVPTALRYDGIWSFNIQQ